jgi:hypothetical protein
LVPLVIAVVAVVAVAVGIALAGDGDDPAETSTGSISSTTDTDSNTDDGAGTDTEPATETEPGPDTNADTDSGTDLDTNTDAGPDIVQPVVPTTSPFPGVGVGAGADVLASVDIATQLARAYADGDWVTVRRLNPTRASSSDSALSANYGDLEASVPVWVSGGGGVPLRLGLVAHQTQGGSQVTTIYCVTWSVDSVSSTVYEDGSRSRTLRSTSGWVDPNALVGEIQSSC